MWALMNFGSGSLLGLSTWQIGMLMPRFFASKTRFQVPGFSFQVERIRKPCVSQDCKVAWNLVLET